MADEQKEVTQRDWLGHGVQYLAIVVTVILFWFATQGTAERQQDETISKLTASFQALQAEVKANEITAAASAAHGIVVDGKLDNISNNLATVLAQIQDLKESWQLKPSKR